MGIGSARFIRCSLHARLGLTILIAIFLILLKTFPLLFLLKATRGEISLMLRLARCADYVFTVIFLYERSK